MLFELPKPAPLLAFAFAFKCPQRKKSGTEMSGDLDGQAVSPKPELHPGSMAVSRLIHVLCVLWYRLAETRAYQRRRQHPLLTFAALLSIVLRLRCLYCMSGTPLKRCYFFLNKENILNSILPLTSIHFRASCIQTDLSKQRYENHHILLAHHTKKEN